MCSHGSFVVLAFTEKTNSPLTKQPMKELRAAFKTELGKSRSSLRLRILLQELAKQRNQRMKIILARIPNNHRIDLIIAMYNPMAHAGHQCPRNARVCLD